MTPLRLIFMGGRDWNGAAASSAHGRKALFTVVRMIGEGLFAKHGVDRTLRQDRRFVRSVEERRDFLGLGLE